MDDKARAQIMDRIDDMLDQSKAERYH